MIEVNVLESVSHDRYHLHKGQTKVPLPNGIAEILKKSGFVEYDSSDLVDDLVGGKMEPAVANKMEPSAENKAVRTPKK